ncbi:coiled-coil domain-containing protein 112 isoform X2 [Vanacampus margaritifer]
MAAIETARQQSLGNSDPPSSPAGRASVERRESRLKATQFLKEVESTRRLVDKLEKDGPLSVQCKKNGWADVVRELDEYEKTLVEKRSEEKTQLQTQLAKIKNGVRQFQQQLIDIQPSTELIEKLKEVMSEVEFSMNSLKEKQHSCLGELLKEEKTYAQEMVAYERKVENWSHPSKPDAKVSAGSTVKQSKALDHDLPSEVRILQSFLQRTGGVCGGWDEFDHQAFLKVWRNRGGRPDFGKEAKRYLPNKSQEEMEEHQRWYQELIHLQDKRRQAIQRWKSRKQLERQTHLQKQAEVLEAERKKKDTKSQHNNEEERKMLTQRLEEWRETKRNKEEQAVEHKRAGESHKKKTVKKRFHLRETKLSLGKELQGGKGEEEDERRTRRKKQTTKAIRNLIKRDLERVQAKRQEKLLRQKENEERQERIMAKLKEKVDGHIVRDPSRLTQPTKGWEERLKSAGTSGGGRVLHMPHRSVPSWRLGL